MYDQSISTTAPSQKVCPNGTEPYGTVPYRTVPYDTVRYRTVRYRYRTVPYCIIPYRTVPYRITTPNRTTDNFNPLINRAMRKAWSSACWVLVCVPLISLSQGIKENQKRVVGPGYASGGHATLEAFTGAPAQVRGKTANI